MSTAAFLLGAGDGSRFASGHKLRADFRGRPLLEWSAAAPIEAGFSFVAVVWGAVEVADVVPDGVELVHNPDWAQGQASSLVCAVDAAAAAGFDSFVVGLADQPLIGAEAWKRVGAATSPIAVATYDGKRRNPVRFDQSVWHLLPTDGDQGARRLIEGRDDLVEPIPCPGNPVDIDTLEDLARWS